MPKHDFERITSVEISHPQHGPFEFSAILEQGQNFLNWNRMLLIGSHEDYKRFLPICDVQLDWKLYINPNVLELYDSGCRHREFGTARPISTGWASGSSIARSGIQKFAELEIRDYIQTLTATGNRSSAIYYFLQRPPTWSVASSTCIDTLSVRGKWRKMPSLGLRLRLLTSGYRRQDSRVSHEVELIEIPGVEIQPIEGPASDIFVAAAEKLWFSIRILITFWFRQLITPLKNEISTPTESRITWHSVKLDSRQTSEHLIRNDTFVALDEFLTQAIVKLSNSAEKNDLLHAAIWGYASAVRATSLENQLTSFVEATERLVCTYEKKFNLNFSYCSVEDWKKIKNEIKNKIDKLNLNKDVCNLLKKRIATPPNMTLKERVDRMAKECSANWDDEDKGILRGIEQLIKTRNDIVHGRLVSDTNSLFVEKIRAQYIFEKLFMEFIGCSNFYSSRQLKDQIL